MLWFMPLTPISKERRKGSLGSYYATNSYLDINPEFGTPEELKEMIGEIHAHGMKFIIDWVANHTGCDHAWVTEHPEWYKKDEDGNFAIMHGWSDVYHLDYSHTEMVEQILFDMKYWIEEYKIDGFRCDMAHLVPLSFWKAARKECEQIKKLYWLAECEEPEFSSVFDTTYAWEWMHASRAKVNGQTSMNDLKNLLHKYLNIPDGGLKLLFTSNHDENSWNGTEYERYGDAAKVLAVFSCLFKGTPLVYTGQEKPNLRRLAFFEKDELKWSGDLQLFDFYKRMLEIRKTHPAFKHNTYVILSNNEDESVLSFLIGNEKENILAVLNLSGNEVKVNVQDAKLNGGYEYLFTNVKTELTGAYDGELSSFSFDVLCTT